MLADRYDIERWREPAYVQLCMRDRPIQESEATLLGVKVTAQLAEVREKVLKELLYECQRAPQGGWGLLLPKPSRDVRQVERLVGEVFWPDGLADSRRS